MKQAIAALALAALAFAVNAHMNEVRDEAVRLHECAIMSEMPATYFESADACEAFSRAADHRAE